MGGKSIFSKRLRQTGTIAALALTIPLITTTGCGLLNQSQPSTPIDNAPEEKLPEKVDNLNRKYSWPHKEKDNFNFYGLKKEYKYNAKSLYRYRNWVKDCFQFSKGNNFCLVIDKAAHKMDLYHDRKFIKTYPVELGSNPYDDKRMEGDGRTPEGTYNVKYVNLRSSFYKALLIDYPNQQDWREFRQWKQDGTIPKNATIGGYIEIHGDGNSSPTTDWTAGCTALNNLDLDDLFERVDPVRNQHRIKVTIVRYGTRLHYYPKSLVTAKVSGP